MFSELIGNWSPSGLEKKILTEIIDLDLDFSFSDKDSQFQIIKQARTAAGNDGDCYSQSKCCSPANLRIKVFFLI